MSKLPCRQFHGEYVGPNPDLKGKTACVQVKATIYWHGPHGIKMFGEDEVTAQFDDMDTGLGYGWHKFGPKDFKELPSAFDEPVSEVVGRETL